MEVRQEGVPGIYSPVSSMLDHNLYLLCPLVLATAPRWTLCASVSWGCYNKVLKTKRLNVTEMYCLTVLEVS